MTSDVPYRYGGAMKILKWFSFPLVVSLLIVFSIIMLVISFGALVVKVFGEAWFTLKEVYRD
jgi:hypothetical protein